MSESPDLTEDIVSESETTKWRKDITVSALNRCSIDAEKIAVVQTMIIRHIIKENIPESGWQEAAASFIALDDDVSKHSLVFKDIIERNIAIKEKVDAIWEKVASSIDSPTDIVAKDKDLGAHTLSAKLTSSGNEVAKKIIGLLDPKTDITDIEFQSVIKGRRSFFFILDEENYHKLLGKQSEGAAISKLEVPVLFASDKDYSTDIVVHEIQHVDNNIFNEYKTDLAYKHGRLLPEESEFLRQAHKGDAIEARLHDEALAQFTVLDGKFYNQESLADLLHYASQWTELIKHQLCNSYLQSYGVPEHSRDAYIKEINSSIDSFHKLFVSNLELYKLSNTSIPVNIAINTLQKFDLNKWPAVVNLILKKRNSKKDTA